MYFNSTPTVLIHIGIVLVIQIAFNLIQNQWKFTEKTTKTTPNKVVKLSDIQQLYDGSSVWCTGSNKSERICKFRNLCYHPIYQEFIFLHGNRTVHEGIPENRFDPALLDMSSVNDHNTQYFNYVDFPVSALDSFQTITVYNGLSFIIRRFNCENIMHVFHDDLLPLFHTMKQYCNTGPNAIDLDSRLVFMEGWDPGPYFELYKLFSDKEPLLKDDLTKDNSLKCFKHAVVGISKATTWYQYGFKTPQGPLPRIQTTAREIREFTEFIKQRFGIRQTKHTADIVLFLRRYNRLVLNDKGLSLAMAKAFNRRVLQVSKETHSLKELIEIISSSSALVGMHGSALILTMFLPPESIVVEMFPYGINPRDYLPYRTLAEIPGMNLIYASWRNILPENTVSHPDDTPLTGGIKHLPKEQQELIQNTLEVPPHLCCYNPFWLYRIYQDTLVDEPSFLKVMEHGFQARENLSKNGFHGLPHSIYPSKVLNITCIGVENKPKPSLSISWVEPINTQYLKDISIKYEVWIQKSDKDDYMAYMLPITQYVFTDGLEYNTKYMIWIRCIAYDNLVGSFASVSCSTLSKKMEK